MDCKLCFVREINCTKCILIDWFIYSVLFYNHDNELDQSEQYFTQGIDALIRSQMFTVELSLHQVTESEI